MQLSQPADWVNKSFDGYIVNTGFSDENTKVLSSLTQDIKAAFKDAVFCMPDRSLHITLLDWVAPLVNYDSADKNELFAKIQPEYDKALSEVLSSVEPIVVTFDELRVSPSTIFIVGHDSGEFRKIRESFIAKVELLTGTKLPPQIIHSSLARFTKPVELSSVNSFVSQKELNITQIVADFRLVHSKKEPMLEFEIIKNYTLQ